MAKRNRREEIARLLAQRERRGLTYRELSERSGVAAQTLSWWAWKLRREATESPPAFVEVELPVDEPGPAFEVEAPGGFVLRVPPDFDASALRRLLEVLAAC